MKLKAISKDIVRFLGYIFFLFSSLNSSLGYGHYFSDEILKSVETHTSDSPIQTNQAVTNGTATDQDGNTFSWKTFGNLDWALENAEVIHYNDGAEIPQEQEISSWSIQLIGSWCYVYGSTIHKFYNWYAINGVYDNASLNDPSLRKQFAPSGWRVATWADVQNLASYLNSNGFIGQNNNPDPSNPLENIAKAMASVGGWDSTNNVTNTPGTNPASNNASGFNALANGWRSTFTNSTSNGSEQGFFGDGSHANFWTSEDDPTGYNLISYEPDLFKIEPQYKSIGYSVRFVRDAVVSTSPTMTITSSDVEDGSSSNDGSISLTFTSSESTTDFDESAITLTGGTIDIGSFSGSGTTYYATFTPSGDGPTTIDVAANVFTDSAANGNSAADQFNWTYDGTPPTIVISAQELSQGQTIINDSSLSLSFTISETTNFSASDISSSPQGTIEDFNQISNTEYTATFIPASDGVISIQVVSGVFTDLAGNSNSGSNVISYERDTTPPSILSISSTSPGGFYGVGDDITIKIDFSEPVVLSDGVLNIILETGVNDRTVTIGNSDLNNTVSSIGTYSIQNGDTTVALNAKLVNISSGQLSDSAGNVISDFSFASNISTASQINVDTTPPTLDITAKVGATPIQDGSTTNDTSIDLTFSFAEDVTDFDANDIVYSGGNISSFTKVSESEYTATFTAVGDGQKSFQVSSSAYQDLAGNLNSTQSSFNWNYESTTFPTIQISESTGIISDGSVSNNNNIILMFTASEEIKDFDSNDIQIIGGEVAHGTFSNFLKLSDKLYRITFSPSSDGQKTIFVPQGSFSDMFDNVNDLAAQFSWIHDGTMPSISSISAKSGNVDIQYGSETNDSSLEFTVIFEEDVNDFDIGDLRVTPTNEGQYSQFQALDNKTYKFTFSPSSENEFVVYIPGDTYFDSAGNRNNQSTQFEWKYDVSPPIITISSPDLNNGATTNLSEFTLLFDPDEPITGFDINDISISGGSISGFSGTSDSYSATFSPDSDGSFSVQVLPGLYEDLANNSNLDTSEFTFNFDNSSPSITIASLSVINGSVTNNNNVDLTFTSNVPVESFDISDITVSGGSLSPLAVSENTYSSTLTVSADGDYEIEISPSKFSDENGNMNSVESFYFFTFDSTSPTVEISSTVPNGSLTNNNNINLTFTLSESSTNFQANDISVSGGSISGFSGSGSGSIYSAILTPSTDGLITIDIDGGVFSDEAGNSNLSASQHQFTYDGTSPTIEISSSTASSGSSTNDSSITLDFILSENSIDFQASDIMVTNGSVSDFTTHSGSNYSAKITPTSDGLLSIAVSDGAFTDSYDNPNFASSPFLWNYDGTSPTVSISSPFVNNGSVTNLESLRINFLVSETTNFDENNIEVTGGTLSGFSNSDSGYYAFFEPQDGTSNIKIRSNQFSDSVGNLNLSNTEFTFEYDGTPPSMTISTNDVDEGGSTNRSEIFLTFSFDESVVGLNSGDFQLTNGSLTNFGGTGSTYSAKFLPTVTDNECIIRLVAGTYSDSAGNLNEDIDEFRFNFDLTQPTIEISSPNIDNGGSISASSIDVNFSLSEASTDFIQSGIELEGGSIISFSGSDSDYTATLSFTSQGVKTLKVSNGAFTDSASNPNTTSNIFSWTFDNQPPTITLDGEPLIQLEVNDIYNDPGVQEPSDNLDNVVEIQISGVVDVTKLGDYEVEYTAVDNAGNNSSVKRTFRVLDNTKPEILLDPNDEIVYLNAGDSYSLPFFDYSDNYDEKSDLVVLSQPTQSDLPNTSTEGVTELRWSVRDKSFNVIEKNVQIIVGSPPIITMLETPPYEIELDEPFETPGAYAQDYNGAPLTLNTTIVPADNTDTSTVRSFQVFYNAKDSQNRETNISKTVNIVDKIKPVLSFDPIDGEILTWEVNTVYNDPSGVTASDNYDSEVVIQSRIQPYTGSVDTSKLGRNNLFFDVSDTSGNAANTLTRFVDVEDTTPPSIQLDGAGTIGVNRKENFVDPGVILNDNYNQSSDIVQITTIRNGNDDVVPVVNTYVLDTYTITYSARDTSGNETAEQDQLTRTVIIEPIVDASASSTVVCAGESVTLGSSDTDLQDANGNNYTIEWTSSPDIGVELGNTQIISAIVTQTTTFTLTLIDSDGNTFSDSSTVQVNPLPSFTLQEDAEICEGSSINLGVGIVDESAAGYVYRWESIINGFISSAVNPSYTPISTDTVTLTVTSPAGCQESDSFEITVVEKPIITFPTGDEFEICEGDTFNITSSLFNVQNAENYSWSVTPQGTGTFEDSETDPDVTIFTPNSTGIAAGQVLLTLTATDQTPCTGSKAESITLDISPQATMSLSPVNSVVCSTSQIEIDILGDNYDINSLIVTPSSALVNLSSKKIFYTPIASDITNNSVTIELSVNQLSPCAGTINTETTISVIPQATVDITSSPIVECYDPASPLISLEDSGAEITNSASFEWRVTSGGGSVVGGDFSDPKTWFYSPPTSVPTTATLELFVTPNSPCPDSEVTPQTLVIDLHQTPEIIKKADNITFCEGDDIEITSDIIEYNNTSQSNFLWSTSIGVAQPGSFTAGTSSSAYPVYQPSQQDIENGFVDLTITVTPNSSSACEEPVSETIRFNVNKTKIVELGDPVDVCESQGYFDLVNSIITDTNDPPSPYTPTSGISWERVDNGSVDGFDFPTSLTPKFTFSQSDIDNGQVIVKMTYDDGLCNTISDTKIINIIRSPFADLGATIDICVGDQTVLNNFTIRPIGEPSNITWELLPDSGATGLTLVVANSPTPTLNATDSATGSYELKVTIDPVDGCGDQVVETVDVYVIEKPTVDLSLVDPDNFEVCQGDDFTFSIDDINILTEHAGGYIWSSFGDGFFDQPGNLTSNLERPNYYSPGPNDIASGSVELKLTLTPQNPCPAGDYFQTITIPISRNPVIQGPNEIDICVSDNEIVLSEYFSVDHSSEFTYLWETSSLDGGFTLDQTSLNNTYEPSTGEKVIGTVVLTLTATDVDCNVAAVKNITVHYNENPTVYAGPDDVFCESTVEIPLDGDFFVDERANNSGYIVYWTAVNGDPNGYFLETGTVAKPKYIPQGIDFEKTDTNQEGLKLRLTLESTVTCEKLVSDEVEFWFEPKPTVSLPADLDVCNSILSIQLSAAVVQNEDPSSYNWESSGDGTFDGPTNPNSSNISPVYYFGENDLTNGEVIFTLSVSGKDGCSNTEVNDTQTITLIPQPTADLSGETMTVCYPTDPIELATWPGEELDIIDVFGTDAVTNIGRVEWTSSDGVITNSNSLSPIFKPTNNSGTAELTLTVYPMNESTCTTGTAFCCGTAESTLTVNIVQKPTITFPSNKEICQGESLFILPNEVDLGDITDRTLLWEVSTTEGQLSNFTSLTPSFVPLADQVGDIVFTLTITPQGDSLTECTDPVIQKQFTLTIDPSTVVDAGPPEVAICRGDSYTTNFANVQYSSDPSTWEWSTDSPDAQGRFRLVCDDASTENNSGLNVTYCPSEDDYDRGFVNLTLTVPNEGVCIDNPDITDTITLRFIPKPTVEIKGDEDGFSTTFCYSENYVFSDGQVSADNESSYKWERSGDGTFLGPDDVLLPTYDPGPNDIQSGGVTLKLTVFGTDGCVQSTFDEIELTILPEPTLNFKSPPTSACINDEDIFVNVETNLDNYNISWTVDPVNALIITEGADGLSPTFKPLQTGSARITATINGGDPCSDPNFEIDEYIDVDVVGLPEITSFPSDQEVCFEDTITLEAPAEVNEFVDSLLWTDYYFTLDNSGNELPAIDNSGNPLFGTFANTTNPDFGLYTPPNEINDYDEQVYVRLTMTASGSDPPCDVPDDDVNQSLTLTLTPAPKINNSETLWGDATVCAGEDDLYTPLVADLSNYDSYEWSSTTSTDGEWFNQNSLQPSYRPSEDEINARKFTLRLKVFGNGSCDEISIEKEITVVPTPIAELSDLDVCYPTNYDTDSTGFLISPTRLENFSTVLWSAPPSEGNVYTPGRFSINSDGSALNGNSLGDSNNGYRTYYYPSADDYTNGKVVITLTANPNDPCAAVVSDTMELILTPEPVIDVGGPYSVCEDQDSIQLNGSVINGTILSWSSPDGIFSTDGNTTYTLTDSDKENGKVTLTLTVDGNGNCGQFSDTVDVDIVNKPTYIDSSGEPNVILCEGDDFSFSTITVENYERWFWTKISTNGNGIFRNPTNDNGPGFFPTYEYDSENPDGEDPIEFLLTIIPKDPCLDAVYYTKTIQYGPKIEASLEDPFEFCQASLEDTFGIQATAINYSSVLWEVITPGSGILSNPTDINLMTYRPSDVDWRRGYVELKLTVQPTSLSNCEQDEKRITIDLIANPEVNLEFLKDNGEIDPGVGDVKTICLYDVDDSEEITPESPLKPQKISVDLDYDYNDRSIYNWEHNGEGYFNPSPDDSNVPISNIEYVPHPNDVDIEGGVQVTLTVTNPQDPSKPGGEGCSAISFDTLTLIVSPVPTVDAGPPTQTICEGDQIILNGSSINASSVRWEAVYNDTDVNVPGVFSPIDSEITQFTPAPEAYQTALTSGGIKMILTANSENSCGEVTASSIIYINRKPIILFGDENKDGILNGAEVPPGGDENNNGVIDVDEIYEYTICEGEDLNIAETDIHPSVTYGQSYEWTSLSGGTFNGQITSNSLEPLYEPTQDEIDAGFVVLQLQAQPTGACSTIADEEFFERIRINIVPKSTLNVIPVHQICQVYEDSNGILKGTEYTIPGTTTTLPDGEYSILWSETSDYIDIDQETSLQPKVKVLYPNPNFTDGGQITITARLTSGCDFIEKDVIIDISPVGVVDLGDDIFSDEDGKTYPGEIACSSSADSFTLNPVVNIENISSIIWSDSGTGSITSGEDTLTPTYTPGPGEFGDILFNLTATGTDANCNYSIVKEYVLRILEPPSLTLNPSEVICSSDDIEITAVYFSTDELEFFSSGTGIFYNPLDTDKGSMQIINNGDDFTIFNDNGWRYQPSVEDLANPDGVVIRVIANNSSCDEFSEDTIEISFNPEPVAIINNGVGEATICEDKTQETSFDLVGFVDNHSDFYWEIVSGEGRLNPGPFDLNTSYIPSPLDVNNGDETRPETVVINLVAVGLENCNETRRSFTLNILKTPFVEIDNSTVTICETEEIDFDNVEGSLFQIHGSDFDSENVEWISSSDNPEGFSIDQSSPLYPTYTPSDFDILQGSVELTVRVYGKGACGSKVETDKILVQFSKKPEVKYLVNNEPTYELEICEGETSILLDGGQFTNVTQIEWRKTNHPDELDSEDKIESKYIGTGYFDFTNSETPRYFPSDEDFNNNVDHGYGEIKLIVIGRNDESNDNDGINDLSCKSDTKIIKIKLHRKPVILYENSIYEVCEGETEIQLAGEPSAFMVEYLNAGTTSLNGPDNVVWNKIKGDGEIIEKTIDGTKYPFYVPSGDDYTTDVTLEFTVNGGGDCGLFFTKKEFEIRFDDKPILYAGSNGTICDGDYFDVTDATLSGSTVSADDIEWEAYHYNSDDGSLSQADGVFDFPRSQNKQLFPRYNPGTGDVAHGELRLYMKISAESNPLCGNVEDYMILTIDSPVEVNAGPSFIEACSDQGQIQIYGFSTDHVRTNWVKVNSDGSSTTDGISYVGDPDISSDIFYQFQDDDIENGFVTLRIQSTGSGACNVADFDQITVTIIEAIDATAGESASICNGEAYTVNDAEIFSNPLHIDGGSDPDQNGPEGIKWTVVEVNGLPANPTNGLSNEFTLQPTYTPSSGDEKVKLRLELTQKVVESTSFMNNNNNYTYSYPCSDPKFYAYKTIYIANDLQETGSGARISGGDTPICTDTNYTEFRVVDLENALDYEWTIPNGATFENNTDKNDSVIYVSFSNFDVNSTQTISVIADNGCEGQSRTLKKDIEIKALPILTLTTANDIQQLCYNTALSEIVYDLSGGSIASEIDIDWALEGDWTASAPDGFESSLSKTSTTLKVAGSYSSASVSGKVYEYRFISNSSDCYGGEVISDSNGDPITGTITFKDPPTITRDTNALNGELVQDEICSGTTEIDLINISYDADNVRIDWLDGVPDGIEYNDDQSGTITIGGKPKSREGDVTSAFRYELTPIDSQGCEGESIEGSFEIDAQSSVVSSPSNPSISPVPNFCDGDIILYSFTLDTNASEIPEIKFSIDNVTPPTESQKPNWINISELNADKTFTIAGFVDSSFNTTLIEFYFDEPANACNGGSTLKKYGEFNISRTPSILNKSGLYNVDGNPGVDASGPKTQIICDGEDLDDIILEVKPAGTFVNDFNLPIGVNLAKVDAASTADADVYIISGSPNNSNNTEYIFNYTIEAETTSGCRTEFTGTITRNVEHTLTPYGSFSTDPPPICEGSAIEQISYTFSSGADGVLDPKWYEVDELGNETLVAKPNGILVDKGTSSNPIVTISGTPTLPSNSDQKIYKYYIETISSTNCDSGNEPEIARADGTITINPIPYFERQNNFATESFCEGSEVSIVFKTDQNVLINEPDWSQYIEGNNIEFDSPTTDTLDGKLVWNLTGTVNGVSSDVNLNYTLEAVNRTTLCSSEISGTIIINNKHDLDLIQGNDKQTICEGSEIQDILYRFGGAANSVEFKTPLLSGLNYEFIKANENDEKKSILRIYGSPSEQVPLNDANIVRTFTIETSPNTGNCGTEVAPIEITVLPKPQFISSQTTVVVCEGQPMQDMVFSMINNTESISFAFQWTDESPIGIIPVPDINGSPPTFTLSGTPDGVDDDKLYPFTLQARGVGSNSCVSEIIEGSILVQNSHEIGLTINSGQATQEICAGDAIDPIVIEWGGGASNININNLPSGLNPIVDPNGENKITISGAPIGNGGVDLEFSVVTQNNTDSCDSKTLPIKISVVKQPTISVNLNSPGTRIQTGLCEGDDIEEIDFVVENGVTDADIIWTPQRPGLVYLNLSDINNGNISLKGNIDNINPDIEYEYEIFAINNDKGCVSASIKGSLQADQKHELNLISTFITTSQNICYQEDIEEIVYTFGGGANSARVDGLPRGIGYRIENDRLIIFGSLEQQVDNTSTNQYTVITSGKSGNECSEETDYGDFTLVPDPVINLETPFSSVNQYVCEGIAIDDIIYTFAGEATDYVVSGLPPGLDLTEIRDTLGGNNFVKKLTISGVPNINISDDKLYSFTVKALGNNSCDKDIRGVGDITVKANAELTLISLSDSDKQVVCVGEEIQPIRIKYENSNIPVVRNMPNGLKTSVDLSTNIFTIQGDVDEGSSYAFSVYGINANGCESLDVPITLDVQPSFSILPTQVVENPNDINNTGGASYVKNITCYGNDDGEIRVNLQGGSATTNYIFVWDGPNNYVNTTQLNHIQNLSPGTYNVTVAAQGARDCSISETFIISEPLPLTITTNEIRPVSCTGSEDGLISVTIGGGNQDFYRNFIWEVLQEDVSCTTYTVRLRDNDNDGIFDIIDADIDNDGSIDPGKTDVNNDGTIDEANDPNYSFGTVSYQSCDGVFIQNNILRGEFSANGIYQVCAIPNTITADAKLDHDLDQDTDNIASVTISGGSASCSAGTWTKIDRLKGSSLASNLIEGIYRLTVIEGPDLNDIESNDLESLRNDPDICVFEEIYELPKDQILYGSVRVDETYCSLTGGYIDIDVNQSAGAVYFYYDGVRVPNTDVEVIAAEFGINTYRVLIQNPNSNGSFEIRNATGCGVVVAQDLLDTNVFTPIISHTSPELEKYGSISERSNILFTLAGNTSYYRVEWDFGDASPVAVGERVSHQYFADGTYTVTVFVYNASGCFTTTTEEIVVGKGYTILMPNAFSPNGDNINEIIRPVFTGLKAVEYYIYNNQGILVYQEFVSEDNLSPNGKIEIMGWDGENSDPSSNFYIYKIIGTRINEELVNRTGTVFLIE